MHRSYSEQKLSLRDKTNEYAHYVRNVHLPAVSYKKQQELMKYVSRLKHPVRVPVAATDKEIKVEQVDQSPV